MAGLETTHRIVEALEVTGGNEAARAFGKLANASDAVARAMGHEVDATEQLSFGFAKVEKATKEIAKTTKKTTTEGESGWRKVAGALKDNIGPSLKNLTIANLLSEAILAGVRAIREFVTEGWNINVAYEAAGSRVQGLIMGLTEFEKKTTAAEKIATSQKAANVIMAEFKDIAMGAALPLADIEEGYARISSVVSGMGVDQKKILEFTKLSTGAAKVYGEQAGMAGSIVAKAIFEGVVEGETAFARAFKAQAQVTSKMKPEERLKKVKAVLESMAGPVETVTNDTAGALTRWSILSKDILQRVTYPIYKKIGTVVSGIVGYLQENEDAVNAIATEAGEYLQIIMNVGGAVWDVVAGVFQVANWLFKADERTSIWFGKTKAVWKILDIAATGVKLLVEYVRVMTGNEDGMGKLLALSTSIELKWHEIAKQIVKVVDAFARMVVPDFVMDKVPGVKAFFDGMGNVAKGIDMEIADTASRLREIEKSAGLEPLTETTRAMAAAEAGIGLGKEARDAFLAGLKGVKMQQNINKVEIKQEFREGDPDRVLVEFVTDLERLGETALQSNVGGSGTAFEGGGNSY